jgi:hypothetical protein
LPLISRSVLGKVAPWKKPLENRERSRVRQWRETSPVTSIHKPTTLVSAIVLRVSRRGGSGSEEALHEFVDEGGSPPEELDQCASDRHPIDVPRLEHRPSGESGAFSTY